MHAIFFVILIRGENLTGLLKIRRFRVRRLYRHRNLWLHDKQNVLLLISHTAFSVCTGTLDLETNPNKVFKATRFLVYIEFVRIDNRKRHTFRD